jgi:P4 family phage/plasmid primase-like protien
MHGGDYHGDTQPVHDVSAAALRYAARGWHVLPCDPQTKHPLIERGLYAATTDPAQIEAWWRQWPFAMIGIRTGPESGIIVLDVDVDPDEHIDGFISIAELEKTHGTLPDTLRATTPRGGEHLYFKWHDGIRNNNSGKLGDHIDVRGRNGFVIAPPSMRGDRKSYSWREDCAAEPAEAPAWLIELLTTPEAPTSTSNGRPASRINGDGDAYASAALDAECTAVASAAPGGRNTQLNKSAFNLGQLVGSGVLTEGEVKSRLFNAASACGLVKDDGTLAVNNTIASGLNAGIKQPRQIPERKQETPRAKNKDEAPPFSDDALALRFAENHAAELRHVAKWSRWFKWDTARWQSDDTLNAFDRARVICRAAALSCNKPKQRKELASARTVAAVERLARADQRMAATGEQWDADAWTFNTGERALTNATYDLKTGIGHPPDPQDYITKITACSAAPPGTPHPLWSAFLDKVTAGNVELQKFLQRYIGYCCTGVTTEHVFVFAYGTGANGKGTFINTIKRIFGDYATVADMDTFLVTKNDRHPTDLAKLRGARLVVAQETQKGRRWDETKIKALTGGDPITARFMRQDFFDFNPTFKLFIVGNHKPRLSSVDEAMRRRMLIVPFTVQIPKPERDLELKEKLWGERHAILRWCIDGCLEWQRIGLAPPNIVRATTEEYFADEDTVGQWIEDRTDPEAGPFAFTLSSVLFVSWKTWCEAQNLRPGTEKAFVDALKDKGFVKLRKDYGRGFVGIALKGHDGS